MSSSLRHRFATAASLTAALIATALVVPVAQAAEYEISQCHDAQGRPAEVTPGFLTQVGTMIVVDHCSRVDGQFELSPSSGIISPASGPRWQANGFGFKVPENMRSTRIKRASVTMSIAPKAGDAESNGNFYVATNTGYWSMESFSASAWPGFKDVVQGGSSPAGTPLVQFAVACNGPCVFSPTPTFAFRRAVIVLDDPKVPEAPTTESVGLLDGGPQRGVRPLRFAATDADSGVRSAEVRNNGVLVASSIDNGDCSFARPTPCPQSRPQIEISVDTAGLPDGPQTLELWVSDAAGNVIKAPLPSIVVANTPKTEPAPVTPPVRPTLRFTVSHKVPKAGALVRFSGNVTPAPAASARVIIEARKGKKWITVAVVRTREAGAFRWSHRFKTRGKYRMRARLLGLGDAGAKPPRSPERTFRVR